MIRDFVQSFTGYSGFFVVCVVSGVLIPLPEDFPLLYAGIRVADSAWGWVPTVAVGITGVFLRDVGVYFLGRWLGAWLLAKAWFQNVFGADRLDRAQEMVCAHGASAVFGGRFLVGLRAPVFMVAGASGVSLHAFILWDLLGVLIVVPATIALGYVFGAPLVEFLFWALQRMRMGLVLLMVVLIAVLVLRIRSERRTRHAEPDDAPDASSNR